MSKKILRFLSYVLVAAIAAGLAYTAAGFDRIKDMSKLDRLENLIQNRFIGEVDTKAMEDAAANAMIDSLGDRWSYYLSAEEYVSYQENVNNAYVGIGVTILKEPVEQGFPITEVAAGGPAEEAGILPGDVLTHVEGKDILALGLNGASELMRGEENTSVTLTVLRGTESKEFTVVRKSIQSPVAVGEMLPGNVGYIRIENFDRRCHQETTAAIAALREQGAKALLFDVRNNPGGYKNELVKLLDDLLPEGPLFYSEDYTGEVTVDESDGDFLDMPMAVLVNGDSYSAAEFFAAALSEYDAAVVVGQQTCGKGYFQSAFPLGDGSAVGLSIGKYYTPKHTSLANVGLTPDIPVEVDEETYTAIYQNRLPLAEDPQVQAALNALKGKG